jgi:hypothetical protein
MTESRIFAQEESQATRSISVIAVVNREFPTLTTTFHYQEYRELAKSQAFAVKSYAFKRPASPPAEAADIAAETRYLPSFRSAGGMFAVLRVILRHPRRSLGDYGMNAERRKPLRLLA